jgi:ABC-type dipeptide/oligopeptide/nickel transport systems, permease components
VPSIVMGPILAYYLGVKLMWFPVTVDKSQWSLILPSFVLGLGTLAMIARMMRTTMLDVISQDYIMTAKAKGLSQISIIRKHMVRNAIMPVITVLGPLFASIITGSIVIERVFAIGGLGEYFVNSIMAQDYPMIMGITIFYAILIILSILVVDVLYVFIDPRLKLSGKKGD